MESFYRVIKVTFALFVLTVIFASAASAGFYIELAGGINLIDFMGSNEINYTNKDSDTDESGTQDFTLNPSPMAGIIVGAMGENYLLAGEIFSHSGRASAQSFSIGEADLDSGTGDFRFFKAGFHGRYYFKTGNDALKPFVGGALDLTQLTIDPDMNKVDPAVEYLANLGIFGGFLFQVHEHVMLGASLRLDIYYPVIASEQTDVYVDGDKLTVKTVDVPFSGMVNIGFPF